jgi:hypothetical protein
VPSTGCVGGQGLLHKILGLVWSGLVPAPLLANHHIGVCVCCFQVAAMEAESEAVCMPTSGVAAASGYSDTASLQPPLLLLVCMLASSGHCHGG